MKICITSSGDSLESQIDPRFGRCSYFIIWDYSNNTFEVIANPNIDAGSGAGIQSAQLVVAKNVSIPVAVRFGVLFCMEKLDEVYIASTARFVCIVIDCI